MVRLIAPGGMEGVQGLGLELSSMGAVKIRCLLI